MVCRPTPALESKKNLQFDYNKKSEREEVGRDRADLFSLEGRKK